MLSPLCGGAACAFDVSFGLDRQIIGRRGDLPWIVQKFANNLVILKLHFSLNCFRIYPLIFLINESPKNSPQVASSTCGFWSAQAGNWPSDL
jgi:hypothetical protein